MANALWERLRDEEYYRMRAVGERADRKLAERDAALAAMRGFVAQGVRIA